MSKTVITYGTFDMFHIAYLRLIQRLPLLGDRLIVAVSTDEFNLQKGKQVLIPFEQRAEIVAAIAGVDMVIPETSWKQKKFDIDAYNVDVFAIGYAASGKIGAKESVDLFIRYTFRHIAGLLRCVDASYPVS